jgi:hypothetical protein
MAPSFIPALLHRFQTHPMAGHPTPWVLVAATRPRGFFSSFRASSMTRTILNCTRMDGGVWDRLQTAVYTVSTTPHMEAVIGITPDGTVLWLDDDLQDEDFSTFVRDEQLGAWIPERIEGLITLLIATKCAYLIEPRLVVSSEDIPYGTPHFQAMLSPEERAEDIVRRTAVAPMVHPPRLTRQRDDALHIEACVWTPIVGRLFAITWILNATGLVSYTGVELAQEIGAWTIMR